MLDSSFIVPANTQHNIINSFISEYNYKIGFYGSEDPELSYSSPYLYSKLEELSNTYSGIVFFSIYQIKGNIINLIEDLLNNNFTIHFAIQKISIIDKTAYNSIYPTMLSSITSYDNRQLKLLIT